MRCCHYDTSDDDMDVDEVVHVLQLPDAPTDYEATQAALLLHEDRKKMRPPGRLTKILWNALLDGTPTYTVVDGGSKKGSQKLLSSEGYAIVLKRTLVSGVTEWRCSVRGKGTGCPAVIKQTGDAFVKGSQGHSHPANPGLLTAVQSAKEIKAAARGDVLESAPVIVRHVLEE
ncbi:hypothetical protein DPMN_024253 [Dreissena polymorpha]|uniref:FLYWCH-type domain-containing protein n=1 Tax=Dreissena polymorpha TaxID=45954 RepID=A0A9D4LR22_DREPO|nr:hypothetical protein DPMN_024253 [Dreissena polymorpha]